MIRFFIGSQQRGVGDILYNVPETYRNTSKGMGSLYRVEQLKHAEDIGDLAEANTFFVMDQTELANSPAAMIAHQKNSSILLINKSPVTLDETVSFYEQLSITTGGVFALGEKVFKDLGELNERTGHIRVPLEELAEVTYPGKTRPRKNGKMRVLFPDRISVVFYNYCVRRWSKEADIRDQDNNVQLLENVGPFEATNDINNADIYLTFKTFDREYLRMISQRVGGVYVPFIDEYRVFDPRSFFKVTNMGYINEILEGRNNTTDHQIAGQFNHLFEAMYDHMVAAFVPMFYNRTSNVNTMRLEGSVDLFTALFYNLSRTV